MKIDWEQIAAHIADNISARDRITEELGLDPSDHKAYWLALWSVAKVDLGLTSEEFWDLTSEEFEALLIRYKSLHPEQFPLPKAPAALPSDKDFRARLLKWYLQNTGVTRYQVYTASNKPCHKPEFYKWVRGDLPDDSATTKNLERFLTNLERPRP